MDPVLKIGLVTDAHYADSDPRIGRYYRESLPKMHEAVALFGDEAVDVAIVLGDLIDTPQPPNPAQETAFLRRIAGEFGMIRAPRYFVLGNHCVAGITKRVFLETVGQAESFFSFDQNGVHCVVLDACFRADGAAYEPGNFHWTDAEIPPTERDWLAADLEATTNPTIVFVHQRLDHAPDGLGIHSHAAVGRILEDSGKVIGVFQGHSHENELQTISGIPYVTLAAMVEGSGPENSGYSVLSVSAEGALLLKGFRRHAGHPFAR